jgi:protein-S-isoprenylcysteine O-methyltransferase Ste14
VSDPIYRPARPARAWWNVTKTLVEIAFLWFTFIIVIPIAISIVEVELAMQRFPGFPVLSAIGLLGFALLGLWAALTLAIQGRGTPLAVDGARRLVVTGPYAFVRNPLVISAVGQGVAIGVGFGSGPILIAVTVAAAWWHFSARKREEAHLANVFGKQWKQYARHVRAIRPRVRPYRAGGAGRAGEAGE